VFGGVGLQDFAEVEIGFLESVGDFAEEVGICP
jgi:hypothetical protein